MEYNISGLILTHAKPEDLIHFDNIVAKEQFDQGLHNWKLYYSLSPEDFWVLLDPEENRKIVGIFTANTVTKDFIWGQQCVILPEYRKQNRIMMLCDIIFNNKHFAGTQNKYSIVAMYKYNCSFHHKQLGFTGSCANRQHWPVKPPSNVKIIKLENCSELVDQEILQNLYKYDNDLYENLPTLKRRQWLVQWLFPEVSDHSFSAVAYNVSDKTVLGYGVARLQTNYYTISPLYANSEECAYALLCFIANNFLKHEKIYMEFNASRRSCLKFVTEAGMALTYTSFRFYRSFVPNLPLDKLYCDHEFWPI